MVCDINYSDHAVVVVCKQQVHIIRFSDSKSEFAEIKSGVKNGLDFATVKYAVESHEVGKAIRQLKDRLSKRVRWKNSEGAIEEDASQIALACGIIRWTRRNEVGGYLYFYPDEMDVMVVYGDFDAAKVLPGLLKRLKK